MPGAAGCRNHGGKYVAGCGDCNAIKRVQVARLARRRAEGTYLPPVPVAVVREHVKKLQRGSKRLSSREISRRAGVSRGTIQRLITDPAAETLYGETAAAILNVHRPDQKVTRATSTLPDGTKRRVQALARRGFTVELQSETSGVAYRSLRDLLTGRSKYVGQSTADRITVLYEKWQDSDGGNERTRAWAIRNGFHGPEAWYETDIDDPDAKPRPPKDDRHHTECDPINVELAVAGRLFRADLTKAELVAAVREMARLGMPDSDIHIRLRWTPKWNSYGPDKLAGAVGNWRRRNDIPLAPEVVRDTYLEERRQRKRYATLHDAA